MCVKLHIDKKFFKVFKAMGKQQSKAKRNLIAKLANETHFTEEEIRQWYKGFFADCPNGRLSQKSFLKIYQQFFPEGDSTKFAKSVFRVFDENKDGLIEFEEFIRSLSITSRGSLDEKLQWSFKLYDENSDGYVTKSEIFAILDYIQLMIQPCQKSAQTNEKPGDSNDGTKDANQSPPNKDTTDNRLTDKEQFKDRQTNSKTNGHTNGNSSDNPPGNQPGKPSDKPPGKPPGKPSSPSSNPAKSNGGGQTNGQLNNQNSTDSSQAANSSREANGDTMGNGEANKDDNRANDTNTEESNGSIVMEPNQILDIKQCKEKIEQIFQKIDKNSITLEQFLQLSKTDPELAKAFYLYNLT